MECSDTIEELKKKLTVLRDRINETKERLPAHSVKPPIMMALLDLEDEYAELYKKIEDMDNKQ